MKIKELKYGESYARSGNPYKGTDSRHWSPHWTQIIVLDTHYWSKLYHGASVYVKGRHPNAEYGGYGVPCAIPNSTGGWRPGIVPSSHIVAPWNIYTAAVQDKVQKQEEERRARELEGERRGIAMEKLANAMGDLVAAEIPGVPNGLVCDIQTGSWRYGVTFDTSTQVDSLTNIITTLLDAAEVYKDYLYDQEP